MRRSYFSPEYTYNFAEGTLNMAEKSNFFSSRMLEIEDEIIIDNIDILWYQNELGEQLDLSVESVNSPISYSPSEDKFKNSKLNLDSSTNRNDLNLKNVRWTLEINLRAILTNYLCATLRKYRTLEGIKSNKTTFNNVDEIVRTYVLFNIIGRYRLKRVDLYLLNRSLNEEGQLKFKNNWNPNLTSNTLTKNYQLSVNNIESKGKISFLQFESDRYVLDYYYNLVYEKI